MTVVIENTLKNNLKLCECGCKTSMLKFDKRGRHRRFIKGHQSRGMNNNRYQNGMYETSTGYIMVLAPNHPYSRKGYIQDHRLVMEEHINRYLTEKEVVHHINKRRWDNRIENLMLFPNSREHSKYELTLDLSNRRCSHPECKNPDKTGIEKNGRPHWRKYLTGFVCTKCYMKIYYKITK